MVCDSCKNLCYRATIYHELGLVTCFDCEYPEEVGKGTMCVTCNQLPAEIGGFYCSEHAPHCIGCGHQFQPTYKGDSHCVTCTRLVSANICTTCKRSFDYLTYSGECIGCHNKWENLPEGTQWCENCGKKIAGDGSRFCLDCIERTCPYCKENKIGPYDYMCETCTNDSYGYKKRKNKGTT